MTRPRTSHRTSKSPTLTGGDEAEIGACRFDWFWFDQAAGEARAGAERDHAIARARAICATCPLTGIDGPCLRDNRKALGVVAGMTLMERTQIGRLQPCGTPAAYQRHLRAGQEPCFPCRIANSEYIAKKNAKRDAQRKDARAAS